ncbi:hypothetical protein BDI4_40082 [Burkholderia diffusa]|nr:hypothetical protein BDI4_40082 [Burkholderia diffusa]
METFGDMRAADVDATDVSRYLRIERAGARQPRGRPALEPDRTSDRPRGGKAQPLSRGSAERRAAAHRSA